MSIGGVGSGAPMMRSFKPPTFESLDSNSSGDVTLDELKSAAPGGAQNAKSSERAEKLFAAMDADSSGSVSSDEKDAFDTKLKAAREAMQFMTQLMAGGSQPPSNEDIFAATDTDGSGGVSLDEFSTGDTGQSLSTDQLSELFSTIDSDSDGSISETESSDFLDTLKSAMGGPGGAGGPPPGGPPPGGPPPGGPPPGGSASSSSSEGDDEDPAAINLLTAATTAYSSKQKSADLLAQLSSIFDQAA